MIRVITPTLILFLVSCAMESNLIVHSPTSEDSTPIHYKHVHGSVSKNSPPSAIELNAINSDSISIFVWAKQLEEKTTWIGIIYPFIPNIFFSKKEFYNDHYNQLKIFLIINSNQLMTITTDSIFVILNNDEVIRPIKDIPAIYSVDSVFSLNNKISESELTSLREGRLNSTNDAIVFYFPIDARTLDSFNLFVNGLMAGNTELIFPKIKFEREKQIYRAMGP